MKTRERKGKVTLRQFRGNGWLEPGHDGAMRYTHCFEEIVPQIDKNGMYDTGLDDEQEREFEKVLNMEPGTLSRYNKDYWGKFRFKIRKGDNILDPKVPAHALTIKVLEAHELVANSEAEKIDSPLAEYVITSVEQEAMVESKIIKSKREAYKEFSTMTSKDMKSYLKVIGKRASDDASTEFLEAAVGKDLETNPTTFLAVIADPKFKMKVFIEDCLAAKALVRNGSKYSLQGGDIIGYDIDETIKYLSNDENQEVYISLKSKLKV